MSHSRLSNRASVRELKTRDAGVDTGKYDPLAGGRRGRGTGRGGRGGRSQKRRKKHVEDDDSIDDDGGGENDHDTGVKIGQPRRLEMNLGDQDPL